MKDDRLIEMRVFKAVLDHSGFTAAARALGTSQPFVSRTIAALEERLGVQLLHRSTRGRRLTEEGQRYLQASSQIIDAIDQAEQLAAAARTAPTGDLRISAPVGFGAANVLPLLPTFLADHPGIRVSISLSDEPVNLIEDNIDVAIRAGRLRDSALLSRHLCELRHLVVAAPAYLDQHGRPDTPGALRDHNCLLRQGSLERLNRWPFRHDGVDDEVAVRGNLRSGDGSSLVQLCLAGLGILRLSENTALPLIRSGSLIALLEDYQSEVTTAIHATYLPERQMLPRLRAFVDMLVHTIEPAPWRENATTVAI